MDCITSPAGQIAIQTAAFSSSRYSCKNLLFSLISLELVAIRLPVLLIQYASQKQSVWNSLHLLQKPSSDSL